MPSNAPIKNDSKAAGKLLLYVEQDYSFNILRPLQAEALKRGYTVRWLIVGDASSEMLGNDDEPSCNISEAVKFSPDVADVNAENRRYGHTINPELTFFSRIISPIDAEFLRAQVSEVDFYGLP